MNKLICLFILTFLQGFLVPLFAQKDSTVTQKITSEFCAEFSKKDITKFEGAEMEIGMMIVPLIEKYKKQIEKEWHLSADNEDDYEKISEMIGQEAALGCPKFLEFVRNNLDDINKADEDDNLKVTGGSFQRIDEQVFSSLVIKTKTGKEEKLWWFEYFEGADLLKTPASLSKKNLTVKYKEMEVYDAKLKEYRAIKVIKNLTAN